MFDATWHPGKPPRRTACFFRGFCLSGWKMKITPSFQTSNIWGPCEFSRGVCLDEVKPKTYRNLQNISKTFSESQFCFTCLSHHVFVFWVSNQFQQVCYLLNIGLYWLYGTIKNHSWHIESNSLLIHPLPLTQPMDPEKKSLNFIFPTKYVIPKSLSRLDIGQVRP